MKFIALSIALLSAPAFAQVVVDGHYRRDGTYVQPHIRSSPNEYRFDNYNAQGNINPNTGERDYQRHEYSAPPAVRPPQPIRYPDPYQQRRGY